MPAEYRIRPIGRPKVERASNGLRKITRRYVVEGAAVAAAVDSGTGLQTIESHVFLPFGTKDEEYKSLTQDLGPGYSSGSYVDDLGNSSTDAYLVAQEVVPTEEVTQAYLTRVYQELEATSKPVQVDQDDVVLSDAGRITVQRTYVVKNSFTNDGTTLKPSAITPYMDHYDPDRIGVDFITVTHSGTARKCYLGGVKSDEHEVHTEYTETFYEDAILSQTIEYRNGLKPEHKLEIRTIRAISGAEALDEPSASLGPGDGKWYLVSEREGPGSVDFGQAGKPVKTKVWAKGRGIVSLQRSKKHDGALETVSIRALGEQSIVEDAGEADNGATFHRVSESMQESSGHQVFNDTYAAGKGRISVSTQSKGKIDIVSETWISEPGGTHSSELENIFDVSVAKRDGFDLHQISGTSHESGVISVNRQYKNQGTDGVFDLEIVRVVKIGALPTSDDFDAAGNGAAFVLVSENKDESGRFVTYTGTFAAGVGTIQTGERNTGKVTVKSYTSLNTDFPSDTYDHTVSDRDGYVVRTYKTYEKDSTFAGDKTKSWLNKYVYRENLADVGTSVPSSGTVFDNSEDAKVSGSYSKQAPSALWSTSDSTVYTNGAGVISSNVSYVASGGYLSVKKVVASASGASAATYAPSNSVLVGQSTSYERGWVRDTFTWVTLSDTTEHSTSSLISWTLPGVMYLDTDQFGRPDLLDKDGKFVRLGDETVHLIFSERPPHRIQLPITKTTKYSLSPMSVSSTSLVPWASVKFEGTGDTQDELRKEGGVRYNYVYALNSVRLPAVNYYLKKKIDDFSYSLKGWRASKYNDLAEEAVLSANQSVAFTDGTNTIWKLEYTVGSPTLDSSPV